MSVLNSATVPTVAAASSSADMVLSAPRPSASVDIPGAALSNGGSAVPSSSGSSSASDSESSPAASEYDRWDAERYVQARHFSARLRFWQLASDAAKQRMVRALYDLPAGAPATIQARENGWIPL